MMAKGEVKTEITKGDYKMLTKVWERVGRAKENRRRRAVGENMLNKPLHLRIQETKYLYTPKPNRYSREVHHCTHRSSRKTPGALTLPLSEH